MKRVPEHRIREEASHGKNEPMAKSAKVTVKQNAEVGPSPEAAEKQPGTDLSSKRER
jgi:hypothetical protein